MIERDKARELPDIEDLAQYRRYVRRLARRHSPDRDSAEDLEQQTWLRVFRNPPAHQTGVRSWLAKIVHNLAATAHQAESRYKGGLVDERMDLETPFDVTTRRADMRAVERALERLKPEYRDVLRLRYFEGLSPREIAEERNIPIDTVYTRLRRGLTQMRSALEARPVGKRRVSSMFALVWRRSVARVLPSTGPQLAAWFTVSALGLLGWLNYSALGGGRAESTPLTADAPPSAALEMLTGTRAPIDRFPEMAPVRSVAAALHGTLIVMLDEASLLADGEDISIRISPWDDSRGSRVEHLNREQRVARFDSLTPGTWRVVPARGRECFLHLAAGEERSVSVTVPGGTRVTGLLVDPEGRPVPRATVWASRTLSDEGELVAEADEFGEFVADGLDSESWIHARAPGYRPSRQSLAGHEEGNRLIMRLRSTTLARLRLTDSRGNPVGGARVTLDTTALKIPRIEADGSFTWNAAHQRYVSAPDGTVDLGSAFMDRVDLHIHAAGYQPLVHSLWLAGTDTPIRMGRELPIQLLEASVEDPGSLPASSKQTIHGTVRDREGAPIPGCLVLARNMTDEAPPPLTCYVPIPADTVLGVTGPEGRFALEGAFSSPQRIWVHTAEAQQSVPIAVREGVSPGAELSIVAGKLAGATLIGSVEPTPDGFPRLLLTSSSLARPLEIHPDTKRGRFRIEGLPLGVYAGSLLGHSQLTRIAEHWELTVEGQRLNAGRLRLKRSATIRVHVEHASGTPLVKTVVRLIDSEGHQSIRVRKQGDEPIDFENCSPGSYSLICGTRDTAHSIARIDAAEGEVNEVDVTLVPGVSQHVRVSSGGWMSMLDSVSVVDGNDTLLRTHAVDSNANLITVSFQLAAGSYKLVLTLADGRRKTTSLDVGSKGGSPFELDLSELFGERTP